MSIVDFDDTIWTDPFVRKLCPTHKLLFVYLFTNRHRNLAGLYHLGEDVIAFETGLNSRVITEGFKALEPKILYDPDAELVFVINYVKRQFLRTPKISWKITKGIETQLHTLPCGHPFIKEFLNRYGHMETMNGPIDYRYVTEFHTYPMHTLSIGYLDTLEEGEGVREGVKEVKELEQTDNGKDEDNVSFGWTNKKEAFEQFWRAYPTRSGKKVGKQKAYGLFKSLPNSDIIDCILAAENYASSKTARDGYARDPERFLASGYWRDWIEEAPEIDSRQSYKDEVLGKE
jgi:hypothetical protein